MNVFDRLKKSRQNLKGRRGFTLIELIVVMAVIGILVLLAAPRFLGRTNDANATKHVSNARTLEDASERYYMDHGDWPRLTDDPYDSEQIHEYAEKVRDITGEEVELTEGNYYDIDYEALASYVRVPDESDLANYVLRNPVGRVYHLEGLSEEGRERVPEVSGDTEESEGIPDYYVQAADEDFTYVYDTNAPDGQGYYYYTGEDEYVIMPDEIDGDALTHAYYMFGRKPISSTASNVKGVAYSGSLLTDTSHMFRASSTNSLDLSYLNTSNVNNMDNMFTSSRAVELDLANFDTSEVTSMRAMFDLAHVTMFDLSTFDTSNVTDMTFMFRSTQATHLDLSSFDTSNVTSMSQMFANTQATSMDLSYFDTVNVTNMYWMFNNSTAKTLDLSSFDVSSVGSSARMFSNSKANTVYAKTQEIADWFDGRTSNPSTTEFIVK